ncbi:MAG: TlpA family protein disulfide reductase [Solirubrobacteraceae bacterium]
MAVEVIALVKHDCETCATLAPALEAAGAAGAPVRMVSQSSEAETRAFAQRVGLSAVPEVDDDLALSERFDPDAVPAVVLLDGGVERDRVEGLHRARLEALFEAAGASLPRDGLPEIKPGCASITREPEVAARIAARRARAEGRIRARELRLGELEDVVEALHERGFTDGLPVVPPTPERVVAMLEHTGRDPQEVVGVVPPYAGEATVEKVAINAVMAGCSGPELPIVLAAMHAACREEFALHGLIATTHPAGPLVVVSGPYARKAGMNAAGNVLGQGNRANATIGRAVQLTVRNVGGGRPEVEDRAAHGQPGKVGAAFAERLEDSPFVGLAQDRGVPADETGVTVIAAEAPRILVDQLARDPEGLCASLALALESIAHPKQRLAWDGLVLLGPEHGRIFRTAGWDRARVRDELFALTTTPAGELVRGAGGSPEGVEARFVTDPEMPVAKFAAPERILLAHAGGDAGLFSMVYGSWAAGEIGSAPVTESVEPWR